MLGKAGMVFHPVEPLFRNRDHRLAIDDQGGGGARVECVDSQNDAHVRAFPGGLDETRDEVVSYP